MVVLLPRRLPVLTEFDIEYEHNIYDLCDASEIIFSRSVIPINKIGKSSHHKTGNKIRQCHKKYIYIVTDLVLRLVELLATKVLELLGHGGEAGVGEIEVCAVVRVEDAEVELPQELGLVLAHRRLGRGESDCNDNLSSNKNSSLTFLLVFSTNFSVCCVCTKSFGLVMRLSCPNMVRQLLLAGRLASPVTLLTGGWL